MYLPEYFLGQLTLFHSKRTNSFCIYASLNRIEQHATTKFFTICHNMHVFYTLLNGFWLLKFFSRPERCLSFRMSWGNYGYLKRFFVSSKTVSYPNESSRTFSRHDSSELVYTEFLRRLFLKNNRNNLVIKCEKPEYFKRRKLLSRHF